MMVAGSFFGRMRKAALMDSERCEVRSQKHSPALVGQLAQSNLTPDSNIAVIVSQDDLVYEDANGLVDLFVWRAGGKNRSDGGAAAGIKRGT